MIGFWPDNFIIESYSEVTTNKILTALVPPRYHITQKYSSQNTYQTLKSGLDD